jgi:SnoaL-like domain
MSKQAINNFYSAFARLDGAAMQSAYAENARFSDPVFALEGRERIGGMWRMLTDAIRAKGRDVWRLELDAITDGAAHWQAYYRFSATGRLVHNVCEARFRFDANNRIVEHHDQFDFWRWSRQALGPAGLLLGWTPLLRNKVRARGAANLEAYLIQHPSPGTVEAT